MTKHPLPLMDIAKVAALTSLSEIEIRRLVKDREIPHIVIANKVRFDASEIAQWIDSARIPISSEVRPGSVIHQATLLTIDEAAEILCVSRRKLYHMLQKGEIASVSIGRSRRIARTTVHEYLAQRAKEAQ